MKATNIVFSFPWLLPTMAICRWLQGMGLAVDRNSR